MGYVKSYKELSIWQKSMDLVIGIYSILNKFPAEENFALSSQMRRSVVSIPSNIAEGCGRESNKELYHFLNVASGSLAEVETQCYIAYTLGYINELSEIDEKLETVQKLLAGFRKHVRKELEKDNQIVDEV